MDASHSGNVVQDSEKQVGKLFDGTHDEMQTLSKSTKDRKISLKRATNPALLLLLACFLLYAIFTNNVLRILPTIESFEMPGKPHLLNLPKPKPKPKPKVQLSENHTGVASRTFEIDFNITESAGSKQWELIDHSKIISRDSFQGGVEVRRGSLFQASDINVKIGIKSNVEKDLDNFAFDKRDTTLNIAYQPSNDAADLYSELQVIVFLRPFPKHNLDYFQILTENLNIAFAPSLNWDIHTLTAHTSYGDFDMDERPFDEPLIYQSLSVSSINGTIFGYFVPNEDLQVHNKFGELGFFLIPKADGDDFVVNPENINVTTISSVIHVVAAAQVWPDMPHHHNTNIESVSGTIYAQIPHGASTSISTKDGDIDASIKVFATEDADVETFLSTKTRSGDNKIWIYGCHVKDGMHDPLLNMESVHSTGEGTLRLNYPYDWYGEMFGRVENGTIKFDSSSLEDLEQGDGWVRAVRGKTGNSRINATVAKGDMDVLLGL